VRFTLRAYLEAGFAPREAVHMAGEVLERQLGGSMATVLVARYHPRERLLVYAGAGHPPPLVIGSRAIHQVTICAAPPIGAGMRTGTRQTTVSVPGAACVCLHTDGVTESRDGGELFGAERLERTLTELGPNATANALLDAVSRKTDAQPDDMAACLLGIEGDGQAPIVIGEDLVLDGESRPSDRTAEFLTAQGVRPDEAVKLARTAREGASKARPIVLSLGLASSTPNVGMRADNVTLLPIHHAQRRTNVR
jgi:hypothetical protein